MAGVSWRVSAQQPVWAGEQVLSERPPAAPQGAVASGPVSQAQEPLLEMGHQSCVAAGRRQEGL